MKLFAALILALASVSAFAHDHGYGDSYYGRGHGHHDRGYHHGFRFGNDRANGPARGAVYSMGMACDSLQATVAHRGAVIVYYGEDLYERVVAHDGYCSRAVGEHTEPFWAPAADGYCFAGYRCVGNGGE